MPGLCGSLPLAPPAHSSGEPFNLNENGLVNGLPVLLGPNQPSSNYYARMGIHIHLHGEVPRGEKMLYSGTDPESYITDYTLVYDD